MDPAVGLETVPVAAAGSRAFLTARIAGEILVLQRLRVGQVLAQVVSLACEPCP